MVILKMGALDDVDIVWVDLPDVVGNKIKPFDDLGQITLVFRPVFAKCFSNHPLSIILFRFTIVPPRSRLPASKDLVAKLRQWRCTRTNNGVRQEILLNVLLALTIPGR